MNDTLIPAAPKPEGHAEDHSDRQPDLQIILAAPRGFCAGVDRAIHIVERALERYGAPVYVRHEIVHNRYVVDALKAKGAVFVEELSEIPDTDAPVIFSAHGVPKHVPLEAGQRQLFYIDATCPLVSKVHVEAMRLYDDGYGIILIGHAGHPEVIGTMGQLPAGAVQLIETADDAERFDPAVFESDETRNRLAFITQTTLSVEDTLQIVDILKRRFPHIRAPHKEDICYATTNRQQAVQNIAARCDAMLVVGAPNSSNSQRLVEVGRRAGCQNTVLIQRATDIDPALLDGVRVLGITAGASAPEVLVNEIIAALKMRFSVTVSTETTARETIAFKLPRVLTDS